MMIHVKNDLQFPQEVNIFGAGTLGDHVSYFGEVTFGENPDGRVSARSAGRRHPLVQRVAAICILGRKGAGS
jgi:hypothetical protein